MMIDIRQAASAAEEFVRALNPGASVSNLRVEEIERSSDGGVWSVTIGWVDPSAEKSGFIPLEPRILRTLQVDVATGEVTSMKMRAAA